MPLYKFYLWYWAIIWLSESVQRTVSAGTKYLALCVFPFCSKFDKRLWLHVVCIVSFCSLFISTTSGCITCSSTSTRLHDGVLIYKCLYFRCRCTHFPCCLYAVSPTYLHKNVVIQMTTTSSCSLHPSTPISCWLVPLEIWQRNTYGNHCSICSQSTTSKVLVLCKWFLRNVVII